MVKPGTFNIAVAEIDLSDLNPGQRRAVETIEGPLLVLAGAGTGKTRVITYRVAWLIAQGIEPANILALTFTNKAAREMKERIGEMIPVSSAERVSACTFHSFGARLLRRHIYRLGYSSRFDIAGEAYTDGLVRTLLAELSLAGRNGESPQLYRRRISRAKTNLYTPAEIEEQSGLWPPGFAELYRRYSTRLKAMNVVDFDDLLVLVIHLWREFPAVLEACRRQYRYLLVDEYQDTNHAQFILTSLLAGERANLCVVGDDDQSIYGWRGAAVGNILEFQDSFPRARIVRLEQNYRSTNTILEAANQVIAQNSSRHVKALWSREGEGEKITVVKADDEKAEAKLAADLVRERCSARDGSLADFAVLYRSNHLSRSLEQAFRQAGLDYCLIGGQSFYQRKEIIDALSFLRLAWNPSDDQSLLRVLNVPPRGLGDKSIGYLRELQALSGQSLQELLTSPEFTARLTSGTRGAAEFAECLRKYQKEFRGAGNLAGKIRAYLREIGYLDGLARMYKPREDALRRRENILELINSAADYDERYGSQAELGDFLETFALRDTGDQVERRPEGSVGLMTVHGAKGLEFPVVIVIGLEHELFPHRNSMKEGGIEEERRLFYVAATRAREELYLTHAAWRRVNGKPVSRRVSPFVKEVPPCYTVETDVENVFKPVSSEDAAAYLERMKQMFAPETG